MLRGLGSYCDEFGHPRDLDKKVMGIAGLLAWSDDWSRMANDWSELQKRESIPNPFHMVDFVHHTENFSDIRWESETERLRVLGLLLAVVKPAVVVPAAASVFLPDFYSLTKEQQKGLVSPYHVAFQEVTFSIAFATANKALQSAETALEFFGNKVEMVYAKLKKFTGPARELWNVIKDAHAENSPGAGLPGVGHWMRSYTPGDPSDHLPLQVADIWAYSLGRMIQQRGRRARPIPEAQLAFDFFVKATHQSQHFGHKHYTHFDRNEMLIRLGETR